MNDDALDATPRPQAANKVVEPHCLSCGYQLRGSVGGQCPECGRPFDSADPATFADGTSRGANVVAVAYVVALLAIALLHLVLARAMWRKGVGGIRQAWPDFWNWFDHPLRVNMLVYSYMVVAPGMMVAIFSIIYPRKASPLVALAVLYAAEWSLKKWNFGRLFPTAWDGLMHRPHQALIIALILAIGYLCVYVRLPKGSRTMTALRRGR